MISDAPSISPHWEDQSYFSEPEFDSDFQHQHIHKSKVCYTRYTVVFFFYILDSLNIIVESV